MSDGYLCRNQAGCNRNDCGQGLARVCRHADKTFTVTEVNALLEEQVNKCADLYKRCKNNGCIDIYRAIMASKLTIKGMI